MSRYGFVVSASRPEVAKGKVAYSARMRHMDVIRGDVPAKSRICVFFAIYPLVSDG